MTIAPLPRSAHLRSRALVAVRGPDCRSFLQGLLTQDVEGLDDGEWRYGALLTPQGRLLYDMFLIGRAEAVLLDLPAAHRHALVQRLSLYKLRAKVEIGVAEGGVYACGIRTPPRPAGSATRGSLRWASAPSGWSRRPPPGPWPSLVRARRSALCPRGSAKPRSASAAAPRRTARRSGPGPMAGPSSRSWSSR